MHVSWRLPADLATSQTSLDFGSVVIGQPRSLALVLSTTTGIILDGETLTGLNSADFSYASTCPSALAAGKNCTITVTFRPSVSGPESASLAINFASDPFAPGDLQISVT
ncbi:MAG: choice-of-anchor D domain-containing protein [Terriglobia bacterium]